VSWLVGQNLMYQREEKKRQGLGSIKGRAWIRKERGGRRAVSFVGVSL